MKKNNFRNNNLITRKLKISFCSEEDKKVFLNYQRQYSNLFHFTYNRLKDNPKISDKELYEAQSSLNNIDLQVHFFHSARYEAKALLENNKENKVIFGGRKLFLDRIMGNISKDEFRLKRMSPLYSLGQAMCKGNRIFEIIDESHILFKPEKRVHILLNVNTTKSGKRELLRLKELMSLKALPVTVKMSSEYIFLMYDYNIFKSNSEFRIKGKIKDRVFSIDMNPNYIGWSVVDWSGEDSYNIIAKGMYSLKPLNDKYFTLKNKGISSEDSKRIYLNNKRKYEVIQTAHQLIRTFIHFKCHIFSMEGLNIKGSDKERGKKFNSLCNNLWCRNVFVEQIRKYCKLWDIRLLEVIPSYSSFIGNLVYRGERLPDPILSSIEIGRRGYEYYHQYIAKDKSVKKNIILPDLELIRNKVVQSFEELNYTSQFGGLVELYNALKKSKQRYRFSLEECNPKEFFSIQHIKRLEITYIF